MENLISLVNQYADCRFLNIGSGPKPWLGWTCLDELEAIGVQKVHLNSDCIFPLEDESQALVYSSHCIEHLNDATVSRLLAESLRVLAPLGSILIKS